MGNRHGRNKRRKAAAEIESLRKQLAAEKELAARAAATALRAEFSVSDQAGRAFDRFVKGGGFIERVIRHLTEEIAASLAPQYADAFRRLPAIKPDNVKLTARSFGRAAPCIELKVDVTATHAYQIGECELDYEIDRAHVYGRR